MPLITFHEDGSIEFTRSPAMLDLFEGAHKRVIRMTDIRFEERTQCYSIRFLRGEFANWPLIWAGSSNPLSITKKLALLWNQFIDEHSPHLLAFVIYDEPDQRCDGECNFRHLNDIVYMRSYEDAVKVEVGFVDFLRELGYSMR